MWEIQLYCHSNNSKAFTNFHYLLKCYLHLLKPIKSSLIFNCSATNRGFASDIFNLLQWHHEDLPNFLCSFIVDLLKLSRFQILLYVCSVENKQAYFLIKVEQWNQFPSENRGHLIFTWVLHCFAVAVTTKWWKKWVYLVKIKFHLNEIIKWIFIFHFELNAIQIHWINSIQLN
jgi:hypothetical protein